MAYREIPSTAVEIQTGLWQDIVVGTSVTYSRLYSAEGYCFYDTYVEYYDEEGNLITDESVLCTMRTYVQYASTPMTNPADINEHFKSVPVDPSYDIVSKPNQNQTA